MVEHRSRFAVWANSERRNDTCDYCTKQDNTFDCGAHIDSRPGRDTSLHPEIPLCNEASSSLQEKRSISHTHREAQNKTKTNKTKET
jgi:glutaredoxin